jgi:hypothetical protein
MPSPTDTASFPARGKVTERRGPDRVVFAPSNTNYEMELLADNYQGPLSVLTDGHVRVMARKIWTVPSGGNFISPVLGSPRTIQGRIRALSDRSLVVQAGCPITVDFPTLESGIDLANGPLQVGSIVNIMAMPGASFRMQNAE